MKNNQFTTNELVSISVLCDIAKERMYSKSIQRQLKLIEKKCNELLGIKS